MQTSLPSKPHLTPAKAHFGVNALALNAGTAVSAAQPSMMEGAICQGWMLKKRRKKMQGYARRYFVLSTSGILSYSFEPGAPVRDQITLRLASISSSANERNRSIHIDSGTSTFHLKALTRTEYALWMTSLRRFCTFGAHPDEPALTTSPRSGRASLSRSMGGTWGGMSSAFTTIKAAHEIGDSITELEEVLSELRLESGRHSKRNASQKSKKDREKDKDSHKEHGSSREKGGLFGIFHHKGNHSHSHSPASTPSTSTQDTLIDPTNGVPSSPPHSYLPSQSSVNSVERLASVISTLRTQHSTLLSVLEATVNTRTTSPLLRSNEEMSQYMSPASRRHSIGTLASGGSVWFDADDGAEEFILEEEPIATESNANISTENSEEEDNDGGESSDDADAVSQLLAGAETPTPSSSEAKQLDLKSPSRSKVVIRRQKLPAPTSGDDGSLLTVLRKNVGKDLSTVSFPVSFNEPISILQRLAEDVEYVDLLSQAAATSDPVERICLITAFAVSGYACTLYRASRKPFNPMLGETFEDIRMNFVSEKVSHHPPVMACHATGKGWVYWATSSADSKFWGRSLEIINRGTNNVKIGDSLYRWQKPSTFMRNLIVGEKYLAHEGEMVITEVNSGYHANIQFKEAGYWGASRNGVAGSVHAPKSHKAVARIDGSWHEGLNAQLNLSSSSLKVLWRAHTFPPNAHQYYGFTSFTMGLNEITPDIASYLPPTDSRLRPDQRAMEEGNIEIADSEKERLEVAQRQRRKQREESGENWIPRWFEPTSDGEWAYKGGYWEARAQRSWDGAEKLW